MLPLWNYSPFNIIAFFQFAVGSIVIIAEAEAGAALTLENLLEHLV